MYLKVTNLHHPHSAGKSCGLCDSFHVDHPDLVIKFDSVPSPSILLHHFLLLHHWLHPLLYALWLGSQYHSHKSCLHFGKGLTVASISAILMRSGPTQNFGGCVQVTSGQLSARVSAHPVYNLRDSRLIFSNTFHTCTIQFRAAATGCYQLSIRNHTSADGRLIWLSAVRLVGCEARELVMRWYVCES